MPNCGARFNFVKSVGRLGLLLFLVGCERVGVMQRMLRFYMAVQLAMFWSKFCFPETALSVIFMPTYVFVGWVAGEWTYDLVSKWMLENNQAE